MASAAIIVTGAVLTAVTFIGGNYLAYFISGNDPNAAYAKYQKDQTALLDWIATNDQIKGSGKTKFH